MKKEIFYSVMALLMFSIQVKAQQQMYICQGDTCDAFEVNGMNQMAFIPDSLQMGQQPPYVLVGIDSIIFHQPTLTIRELGWRGDGQNGQSSFKAQVTAQSSVSNTWVYDATFTIDAAADSCTSARCTLDFAAEWMLTHVLGKNEEEPQHGGVEIDPPYTDEYVYVKLTQTGPRKYEVWTMGPSVLPESCTWTLNGTQAWSDCTNILKGRPMDEVRLIVETWVYQKLQKVRKSKAL